MGDIAYLKDSRLPKWLRWYLSFGALGKDRLSQRSQFMANAILGIAALSSLSFVFVFWAVGPGFEGPQSASLLAAFVFMAAVPSFEKAPRLTLVLGVTAIALLFSYSTYLLGRGFGIHFYILAGPIFWLAILGAKHTAFLVYIVVVAVISFLANEFLFIAPVLTVAENTAIARAFFSTSVAYTVLIILGLGYFALFRAEHAEEALEAEHARSEALLYNLLPEEIAARLKVEPDTTIADSLPNVAILFADIVNFTPRSASMAPEAIVEFLNRIFSAFDELAEKHGLEKIKTIGDAYMVTAGMPNPCGDPVHRIAKMALDMLEVTADLREGVEVRIGLHAGPAVAGVIGNRKLFYDVWGETVNTASRMESHGEPGRIQVTEAAKDALGTDYTFVPRGTIAVKGMGTVETW